MKSLIFDNGLRKYALNGDENNVIYINLTDLNLVKRIDDMQEKIKLLENQLGDKPDSDMICEMDMQLRGLINDVFGSDVCTPAFGNANICSPVGDGKMLFEGFLNSLTELVKSEMQAALPEKNEVRPAVQKYLDEPKKPDISDISAMSDDEKNELLSKFLA